MVMPRSSTTDPSSPHRTPPARGRGSAGCGAFRHHQSCGSPCLPGRGPPATMAPVPQSVPGGRPSRDHRPAPSPGGRRRRACLAGAPSRRAACRRARRAMRRPTVEVERPADPAHGDLATQRGDATGATRPHGADGRSPLPWPLSSRSGRGRTVSEFNDHGGRRRGTRFHQPAARAERAARRRPLIAALDGPTSWGRVAAAEPPGVGERRVRVGQPDRAAALSAMLAAPSSATCSEPRLEAGGQQVTREYYFNDSGRPDLRNLGASIVDVKARRAAPGGRIPGRLRRTTLWSRCQTTCGRARSFDGRRHGRRSSATGPTGRVREGIEASLERLGVHFDVWTSEARLHR